MLVLLIVLASERILIAKEHEKRAEEILTLPKNVLSISKVNTFPNITQDFEMIEPSEMTTELLADLKIKIDNPDLIKLVNESMINPSPIAFGYRASVYLGRWPLHYESENSTVIWDYQQINENEINNIGGEEVQEIRYIQQEEKEVKGALTNKIEQPETIRKMILQKAKNNTGLPLSFSTVIGINTKLDNYYHVPIKKTGYLQAFAPAVNETGQITFGEVYVELKGPTKGMKVKNVTKQGIGAWIPIQDHVSFSFQLK